MCLPLCTLPLPSPTHTRQGRLGKGGFSPSLKTDCRSSSLCFKSKRSQNIFARSWKSASPSLPQNLNQEASPGGCDRGDIARVPSLAGSEGMATQQQQKAAFFYCIQPLKLLFKQRKMLKVESRVTAPKNNSPFDPQRKRCLMKVYDHGQCEDNCLIR